MPFFQNFIIRANQKNKNVILQVRIPLTISDLSGKRALPFASPGLPASLTVEAAFALPLFIFAIVSFMAPMRMMNQQRKVQAALEAVCSDASQYAYIKYQMESGKGEIPESGEGGQGFSKYFLNGGLIIWASEAVRAATDSRAVTHLSLLNSRILEDGETLDLVAEYELRLPFSIFGIENVPMVSRSRRRAWIGREGISGGGNPDGDREDEEIVFIGKGSTRYHRQRTCHYLYNNLSTVPFHNIGSYRNESGGRYHACSRCGKKAGAGSVVYIMPEGGSYHSDRNCSAIIAYVKAVPLSQVEYLGPCSYCSK